MGILSCSRCKLFLEDGTEDQAYERSDVKYLGAQRERKVLYQFRQPVTEQFRTQSHVIDGDVECHHRRHHGYGKSGCGEDDKDRFVFTRCKYTAHEPFYDRGGYVTLRNECADHLHPHVGQCITERGESDAVLQSGVVECHDVHKDEYHDACKCKILKFCLWHLIILLNKIIVCKKITGSVRQPDLRF